MAGRRLWIITMEAVYRDMLFGQRSSTCAPYNQTQGGLIWKRAVLHNWLSGCSPPLLPTPSPPQPSAFCVVCSLPSGHLTFLQCHISTSMQRHDMTWHRLPVKVFWILPAIFGGLEFWMLLFWGVWGKSSFFLGGGGWGVLDICRYFLGVTFKLNIFGGLEPSVELIVVLFSFSRSISAVHQCH